LTESRPVFLGKLKPIRAGIDLKTLRFKSTGKPPNFCKLPYLDIKWLHCTLRKYWRNKNQL